MADSENDNDDNLENNVIYFVQNDMTHTLYRRKTCKSYDRIKPELDKARNEFGADKFIEGEKKGIDIGEKNKAIKIAENLLKNNVDIDIIISSTGLTKKEINALRGTQSEVYTLCGTSSPSERHVGRHATEPE